MNIAIVTQSYYPRPGGVTENAYHTALELRRRGHLVTVVTTRFGRRDGDEPGVIRIGRNVLVPMNGAWVNLTAGVKLGEALRKVFEHLAPDVIHTHCPLVPTLPLLTLRAAPEGAKLVGTFHAAAESNYAYRILRAPLARHADRLHARVAVSHAALELARKYFPGEYEVIPNGIDYERFCPRVEPIARYLDGCFNILFVGRLDKRKGLKYLLRAADMLRPSLRPRIRIIIVGEKSPRRLVFPRPRGVRIVFAGTVSREELNRYYATAHVFCSPAVGMESFGIVLLEAMASGVPVIASGIEGYLTILENRHNALVVPPRDPKAIARAIEEILDDYPLRRQLRENGLQFVKRYSWSGIAGELERLYHRLLSSRREGCETGEQGDIKRIDLKAASSK
jgi:phosphatidylinositol alpha-mannosyltransferase